MCIYIYSNQPLNVWFLAQNAHKNYGSRQSNFNSSQTLICTSCRLVLKIQDYWPGWQFFLTKKIFSEDNLVNVISGD